MSETLGQDINHFDAAPQPQPAQEAAPVVEAALSFSQLLVRLLLFAVLIWLASAVFQHARSQQFLATGLVIGFLITYRRFLGCLTRYMLGHMNQSVLLILLFCLLYGWLGTSYGVPNLFWYETAWGRASSALGVTLFLAVLGANAYYLDENYEANQEIIRKFLREWRIDYPALGFWTKLDPPDDSNSAGVSHFLRVARLPFLTLISLPALFPLAFPYVPRLAPVRALPRCAKWLAPALSDVGRDLWAWWLGVLCWGVGVLLGVVIVKCLVRLAAVLEKRYPLDFRGNPDGRAVESKRRLRPLILVSLSIAVVAVVSTILINSGWAERFERGWLAWVAFISAVITLVLGVVVSGLRANQLRPNRWPPFLRYLVISALTYSLIAAYDVLVRRWRGPDSSIAVSPGLAVCSLLFVLSLFGAWIHQLRPKQLETTRIRSDLVGLALALVWIGLMNGDAFKMRFTGMNYSPPYRANWPSSIRGYQIATGSGSASFTPKLQAEKVQAVSLLDDSDVLKKWRRHIWNLRSRQPGEASEPDPNFRPKLVVVCATGGASRSQYWTARVLARLGSEIDGFHEAVRLVTGASGGMVGAAYYLHWSEQGRHSDDNWVKSMPTETLPAVAGHIALVNVAQSLLPRIPSLGTLDLNLDRGQVLEQQWKGLQVKYSSFREREKEGELPSVVFTPVTVDDGRRLIISNLDLGHLAVSRGGQPDSDGGGAGVFSVAAPEFYRLYGTAGDGLTLATAARMSATFPMVSPAVNLPTDPPIRIVDAGYYDNYGVNLAVAWIFRNRCWLMQRTSGVVLVQIRAFQGRRERLGTVRAEPNAIQRGIQFFETPISAFGGARESTPMFRNDEEVAALGEVLARESKCPDFFTTIVLENSAQVLFENQADEQNWPGKNLNEKASNAPPVTDVAMTWYLSELEKRSMDQAIPTDTQARDWMLCGGDLVKAENEAQSLLRKPADRIRWLSSIRDLLLALKETPDVEGRRAYYIKELEHLLNYERIQALKSWWETGGRTCSNAPPDCN